VTFRFDLLQTGRVLRFGALAAAAALAIACGTETTPPNHGAGGAGGDAGSGGGAGDGGTGGTAGSGGTGGTGGTVVEVGSVTVTPPQASVMPGATVQLEASVFDWDGEPADVPVAWASSNPDVATVDAEGLVTGVSPGSVTIRATAGGVDGTADVTVSAVQVATVTISADGDARTLRVGETLQLHAEARDEDGNVITGLPVLWYTSNKTAATVDANGLVTGRGPGNGVAIDGWIGGVKSTRTLSVTLKFGAIVTAMAHSCGITEGTGLPFCWGERGSFFGNAESELPVLVPGAPALTKIVAGTTHTCGLTADGAAWCWGANAKGRLGNNSEKTPTSAVPVFGVHVFTDLALGGLHTCGLDDAGDVYCWGDNERGQLSLSATAWTSSPTPVRSVSGPFKKIVAGDYYTCGLKTGGELFCWGNLAEGQTFPPNTVGTATPVRIGGVAVWDDVTAGSDFACGLQGDVAMCWGLSGMSRLGNGKPPNQNSASPVTVTLPPEKTLAQLSAGRSHACALSPEGEAFCWGGNTDGFLLTGQLGLGDSDDDPVFIEYKTTPTPVNTALRFTEIHASQHSCAIATDGFAYCWGPNENGQLGTTRSNKKKTSPTRVLGQ